MKCQVTQQCQGGSNCQTGICQCPPGTTFNGNACGQQLPPIAMNPPTCINPSMMAEMNGAAPKNCAQQYCSQGYQCEWNNMRRQYICCGGTIAFNPAPAPKPAASGQIKIYDFDATKLLQCINPNDCLGISSYTNCVRSARYNVNVCCSTNMCP